MTATSASGHDFMEFTIRSIGTVINDRNDLSDDFWGGMISEIKLDPAFGENALEGIETFSHLEIVFVFHRVVNDNPVTGADHPRENPLWPETGIFAQRKKNRPNFIGTAMAVFIRKEGASIFVRDLDAINGTPVMDIKPVIKGFLPRGPVTQPFWADELMQHYWREADENKPVPIILNDLLKAIEDHCDFACYYLDRETGEIIFQSEHELDADGGLDEGGWDSDRNDHSGSRFIPVEPMESRRGLELVRNFIRTLQDRAAAAELSRSIEKRKPFRHFKDALHNHADLETAWYSFQRKEIIETAEEWLRHFGIHYEFVSINDLIKRHE
jgi:tRNA (adenine37-N6)-methyltransferase